MTAINRRGRIFSPRSRAEFNSRRTRRRDNNSGECEAFCSGGDGARLRPPPTSIGKGKRPAKHSYRTDSKQEQLFSGCYRSVCTIYVRRFLPPPDRRLLARRPNRGGLSAAERTSRAAAPAAETAGRAPDLRPKPMRTRHCYLFLFIDGRWLPCALFASLRRAERFARTSTVSYRHLFCRWRKRQEHLPRTAGPQQH